jgi:uncharacterized protein YlxW (UPF0749 family)
MRNIFIFRQIKSLQDENQLEQQKTMTLMETISALQTQLESNSTEWDTKSTSYEDAIADLESQLMQVNVDSLHNQQEIRELREDNGTFKQENLR